MLPAPAITSKPALQQLTKMKPSPIIRRIHRSVLILMALGCVMARAPLSAQALDGPDPRTGESEGGPGLSLSLDYPRLDIGENRAYIPLFFTVNGSTFLTGDIKVRATFAGGTATPDEDFILGDGLRVVPIQGGLGSMNWVQIPLVQDELTEGDETASFDLTIEGSANAPVRMEVLIKDDMAVGEVGFVSTRFSASEGSSSEHVQVRMWRTLNTRNAATITYKLEGTPEALAALGGESQRTAEFQPGDSQIFVSIPVINDTETQGYREITMTIESSSDGMKFMDNFATTVLTLADDETQPEGAALTIMEGSKGEGQRGVALSTMVPRGYQVLLEFSDSSLVGPWQPYWIFHGSDVEQTTFNHFDASLMRMFRIQPPQPLDITLPW